ncbi:MFS transporter [Streptomyces sp. NPDC059851]|uniref:MFS transporter n=1 Tax=Streptomyces sp. NPDC059851 TaxID=3346971 RepID=UPI00366947C4
MSGAPEPAPLWRNRDFNVFWLGQALSVLGGSISLLALPLLVLDATGSLVQMGVITVISGVTGIATGVFAGYVVDRTDRRRLMITCDLARAVLLGAVPAVWLAGPRIWVLYLLAALVTALKTLFDVAYVSSVPNLVPPRDLTAANARLMGTFAVGTLGGPVAAGFLTAAVGADWALGVDGATFLVSAVSLRWVAFDRYGSAGGAGRAAADGGAGAGAGAGAGVGKGAGSGSGSGAGSRSGSGGGRVRELFVVGFRFLWAHPLLRPLTVLLTLLTFVTMGATDLLIYRIRHDLGQDAATLGYVIAVSGLGVVAAALAAGTLRRVFGTGACWLGSAALIGLAVAGVGVSRSVPVVAALAAVFMFGTTLGGVVSMTLRQEVTPDRLLGRVTSAFWTVHNASGPVGAAALTVLAARHGVPAVSVAAGAFCLLIVVAGLLTPLRGGGRAVTDRAVYGPSARARQRR